MARLTIDIREQETTELALEQFERWIKLRDAREREEKQKQRQRELFASWRKGPKAKEWPIR